VDSEELIFNSFNDSEIQELVGKITVTKDDEMQAYLAENPTHFCAVKVILASCRSE
jgi:hypothetical protein